MELKQLQKQNTKPKQKFELPDVLLQHINEYSKPQTRGNWREGSFNKQHLASIDDTLYHIEGNVTICSLFKYYLRCNQLHPGNVKRMSVRYNKQMSRLKKLYGPQYGRLDEDDDDSD